MYVNTTKFERNSSQQYYHRTCIGEKSIQAKEVYWDPTSGCRFEPEQTSLPFDFTLNILNLHMMSRRPCWCSSSQVVKNKSFLFEK